jgi:glycosyltransferase involved in cell wall biosynthesis
MRTSLRQPARVARLGRGRLVVTIHEFSRVHPLRKLVVSALSRVADRVIVVSAFELDAMRQARWPSTRRAVVIPIGNSVGPTRAEPLPRAGFVYFGLLAPHKGIEQFIAVAEQASAAGYPGPIWAVGSLAPHSEEAGRAYIRALEAVGVEVVTGRSDRELTDLFAAAAVALLPFPDGASHRRSSMLTCLDHGMRVVTFDGPACTDELRRACRVLPPTGGPAEVWAAVAGELDRPPRRRLPEQHEWSSITARHIGVYADIEGSGGHRRRRLKYERRRSGRPPGQRSET